MAICIVVMTCCIQMCLSFLVYNWDGSSAGDSTFLGAAHLTLTTVCFYQFMSFCTVSSYISLNIRCFVLKFISDYDDIIPASAGVMLEGCLACKHLNRVATHMENLEN